MHQTSYGLILCLPRLYVSFVIFNFQPSYLVLRKSNYVLGECGYFFPFDKMEVRNQGFSTNQKVNRPKYVLRMVPSASLATGPAVHPYILYQLKVVKELITMKKLLAYFLSLKLITYNLGSFTMCLTLLIYRYRIMVYNAPLDLGVKN